MTRTASSRRTAWNSAPNRFPRTDFTLARLAIWMLGAMLTLGSHAQEPPAAAPQADPHAGHDHAHHGHAHHNHGPRQPAVDLPPVKSVDPITIPLDVHNKVRRITVQHGGRYKPLDTLAREFATKITGSETVAGQTHLDFLLQCTVQQVEMSRHPLFSISNEKFREQLELSASPSTDNHYSYYELVNHAPFMDHLKRIAKAPKGKKMDDLDKKIKDLESRLVDFRSALLGQYIRLIPHPTDPKAPWQTVDWLIETSDQRYANLKAAWMGFGGAFKASENAALRQAADTLVTQLQALPAKFRPSKAKIEEELHYNEFTPYNKAWKLMMLGVVIALVALFVKKPWCDVVTAVVMFASFALLTYGIKLRWDIANRFPASNMFESLLFLSWGAALFTVIGPILLRNRIVTLTGAAIAGISLMLADVLPVSAYIKPVSPVLLNTFWMALHVPVIMVSYSILAIAVLVAHVQIIGEGIFGKRWKHVEATDTMLYWYVISGSLLLLVGILTGSLWAASSWGRYWGWDPKEVWSLVAFLGYMAILHTRTSREKVSMPMKLASMALITAVFIVCIRTLDLGNDSKSLMVAGGTFAGTAVAMVYFMLANSSFATAAKNIIAFWLIIMTYVGVNYVLGTGLHSYGFGVGNVASKTMLVGGIDLIILGICSLFFYYRNSVAKTDN